MCRYPPLSYNIWHALPFSLLLDTKPPGTYTTLGFSWMCVPPNIWNVWLHWCVGTAPLSYNIFTCSGVCWRCHSPYYWILLEDIGNTWNPYDPRILLDVPCPQYLTCMAALMCRYPLFHIIYSHALGCAGMRCHSPYYWILLEHIGTTWNLYDPMRTVLDCPGCALPGPQYQSEDDEDCGLVKESESPQFLSARSVPCE